MAEYLLLYFYRDMSTKRPTGWDAAKFASDLVDCRLGQAAKLMIVGLTKAN